MIKKHVPVLILAQTFIDVFCTHQSRNESSLLFSIVSFGNHVNCARLFHNIRWKKKRPIHTPNHKVSTPRIPKRAKEMDLLENSNGKISLAYLWSDLPKMAIWCNISKCNVTSVNVTHPKWNYSIIKKCLRLQNSVLIGI